MKTLHILIIFFCLTSLLLTGSTYHYFKACETLKAKHIQLQTHYVLDLTALVETTKTLSIVAAPYPCDKKTQAVLGSDCDLGNYMEWLLPHLHNQTQTLLKHIKAQDLND